MSYLDLDRDEAILCNVTAALGGRFPTHYICDQNKNTASISELRVCPHYKDFCNEFLLFSSRTKLNI